MDMHYSKSVDNVSTVYVSQQSTYSNRPVGSQSKRSSAADDVNVNANVSNSTSNARRDKIALNKEYLPEGIMRFILVLCLLAGWISAAAVSANNDMFAQYPEFKSTQIAYLVLVVTAFVISLAILLLNILNIVNLKTFKKIPWVPIYTILDIFFLLSIFGVSIAAAVRESQLNSYGPLIYKVVNRGAFAVAASFGFVSVVIFMLIIGLSVVKFQNQRSVGNFTRSSTTENATNAQRSQQQSQLGKKSMVEIPIDADPRRSINSTGRNKDTEVI